MSFIYLFIFLIHLYLLQLFKAECDLSTTLPFTKLAPSYFSSGFTTCLSRLISLLLYPMSFKTCFQKTCVHFTSSFSTCKPRNCRTCWRFKSKWRRTQHVLRCWTCKQLHYWPVWFNIIFLMKEKLNSLHFLNHIYWLYLLHHFCTLLHIYLLNIYCIYLSW